MKWPVLIIVWFVAAQNISQTLEKSKYVSLNLKEQPLSYVLNEIRTQAGVNFIYKDKLINDLKISIKCVNGSVENVVKKLFSGLDVAYKEYPQNSYVLFESKKPIEKKNGAVMIKEVPQEIDTAIVLTEPKLLSKINLTYPPDAVRHNLEGKVLIKIMINKEGNVSKSYVEQTSGSTILDSAAIDYSRELKFIPAHVEGNPINIWMSMLFKYFFEKNYPTLNIFSLSSNHSILMK